ncbi:MAG: 2-C-methyl-D-erythritol 4-phosphate cytidylyltransferase [Candidatus Omnitrophota bacterium]
MSVSAVIVAAGLGKRLKAKTKKAFIKLGKKSILEMTVSNFEKTPKIKSIIVVARKDDLKKTAVLLRSFKKVRQVVEGGRERSDSVRNGIEALSGDEKIVLIHDAARPFVTSRLIEKVIAGTRKWGAAIPVLRVSSTVKKIKKGFVDKTVDRENLFLAQTPQGFKTDVLRTALNSSVLKKLKLTDDSALFEVSGKKVKAVEGEILNMKITTPDDLELARKMYKLMGK